jgi:hypothetical protein
MTNEKCQMRNGKFFLLLLPLLCRTSGADGVTKVAAPRFYRYNGVPCLITIPPPLVLIVFSPPVTCSNPSGEGTGFQCIQVFVLP